MTAKAMLRTATTVLRRLMMDDDGGSMTAVPPAAAVVLDDDNVSEAKSGAFDASVVGRFKETTSPNCGEVVVVVELTVVLAALSEKRGGGENSEGLVSEEEASLPLSSSPS
jgi:hypothetical protein